MTIKEYHSLLEDIELVLNNYDLDEFSSQFEHEDDFVNLVNHLAGILDNSIT
jgi:hypothetical protein|tara:strand:+ start:113 stop:268 length:156 start_codon:yes stop_codon:yes gene_type:complete